MVPRALASGSGGRGRPSSLLSEVRSSRLALSGEGVQLRVEAAARDELLVVALVDHAPAVEHDYPVGVADSGQPVSDHDGGAALQQGAESLLDEHLCVGVYASRGLVQYQDPRVGGQRPGEADQLPLAEAQVAAPLV